eukprot:gene10831-19647_t
MMDQEEDELFRVDVPATPQPKCDLLNEEKKPARSGKRKAVYRGELSDLQSKFNSMATELSKVTQTLKAIADIESKRIRLDTGTSAAQSASLVAQSTANDILPLQRYHFQLVLKILQLSFGSGVRFCILQNVAYSRIPLRKHFQREPLPSLDYG